MMGQEDKTPIIDELNVKTKLSGFIACLCNERIRGSSVLWEREIFIPTLFQEIKINLLKKINSIIFSFLQSKSWTKWQKCIFYGKLGQFSLLL